MSEFISIVIRILFILCRYILQKETDNYEANKEMIDLITLADLPYYTYGDAGSFSIPESVKAEMNQFFERARGVVPLPDPLATSRRGRTMVKRHEGKKCTDQNFLTDWNIF